MTRILLLALMLGVAAGVGANEARAGAWLGTARLVAETARDPLFVPAGFKRHGSHRSSGGGHKSFRGPKSFAGRYFGHAGSTRPFSGKRFGHGVIVRQHFGSPRLLHRFGHGGGGVRNFGSLPLFHGKHFGHGDVIVRKHFGSPRLFFGQRLGHREFLSAQHRLRFHR